MYISVGGGRGDYKVERTLLVFITEVLVQEKESFHLAEAINKSFDLYILTLKEVSQHLVY